MKSPPYSLSILVVSNTKEDIIEFFKVLKYDYNSLVELIDLTPFINIEELSFTLRCLDLTSEILDQINVYLEYDLVLIISPLEEVEDICRFIKKEYIRIK